MLVNFAYFVKIVKSALKKNACFVKICVKLKIFVYINFKACCSLKKIINLFSLSETRI